MPVAVACAAVDLMVLENNDAGSGLFEPGFGLGMPR